MSKTKTDTIHMRIEPKLKENADLILKSLGLSTADAVNLFLRQVVFCRGLPFELKLPNEETLQAMKEADDILASGLQRFKNSEEMFRALGI